MGAARPKDREDILIDSINEKTASNGVEIGGILSFFSGRLKALVSTVDLGDTTTLLRAVYTKAVYAASNILTIGTTNAYALYLATNNATRAFFSSDGYLFSVLGASGYTGGGYIETRRVVGTSTSTTPVTVLTYTIGSTNTAVAINIKGISRDNTSGNQCYIDYTLVGARVGGGAVAGNAGAAYAHQDEDTALHTFTVTASSNDLLVKIQNVSGTNSTYFHGIATIYPLATSS